MKCIFYRDKGHFKVSSLSPLIPIGTFSHMKPVGDV